MPQWRFVRYGGGAGRSRLEEAVDRVALEMVLGADSARVLGGLEGVESVQKVAGKQPYDFHLRVRST
jgi:hypothetical protein